MDIKEEKKIWDNIDEMEEADYLIKNKDNIILRCNGEDSFFVFKGEPIRFKLRSNYGYNDESAAFLLSKLGFKIT